jgi:uncharacterized protein
MRLSNYEHTVLVDEAKSKFGNCSRAFLFGSRVNDSAKGGDIDILILPDGNVESGTLFERKISYQIAVKKRIGDRKIDVIVKYPDDNRSIIETAVSEGIEL